VNRFCLSHAGAALILLLAACPGLVRAEPIDGLIQPNKTFRLSQAEAVFIQSLPILRVMIDEDFLPLSGYSPRTKHFQGISVDLFAYIARQIGLRYQFIHEDKLTWSDKIVLFNDRKIDLLFPASYTAERAKHGLFTDSYYTSYYAAIAKTSRNIVIHNTNDLAKYDIGVTKLSSIVPFAQEFVPAGQIHYFRTQHELYKALVDGTVDIVLRNKLVFQEERFNLELFSLDIVYTINESARNYSYYFVTSADNARLVDIINRYLTDLNYTRLIAHYEKGIDELIVRYVSQKQQQRQLVFLIVVTVLVLTLAVFWMFYYRKMSNRLAAANKQLERLNITDALTGLCNRRHFDDVLAQEYARHARSGASLSLIMIDIDAFKQFNDTYGHVAGDACLKDVAAVIGKCASRASDMSARYGGEEFVCILPDTDIQGAVAIAQEIRQQILALAIPHSQSAAAPWVSVSLGVVTTKCRTHQSATHVVDLADAMLFRAKSGGRNRVEFDDYAESLSEDDQDNARSGP
jgi:diguanylate cyclase (GGDEF)-like protein